MNTKKTNKKISFAATVVMLACASAHAQKGDEYTYRCTGKDGKKYYGQTVPQPCVGGPMELINKQGLVIKRIDPEAEEKARLAREADAEKKRELEVAQKEATRRNQALLATYTSERDIEEARTRALRDHGKQLSEVEGRIEALKKRQARVEKELAVYNESGKGEPPARLKEEITNAEIDIRAQQGLLDVKKKEASSINARYDDDKRRYLELTGKDPAGRAHALGMQKGVTVTTKPAPKVDELREQREAHQRAANERAEILRLEREREQARRQQSQRR